MKNFLSWGIDGLYVKHYDCRYCGQVFGPSDNPEEIEHFCIKGVLVENNLTHKKLADMIGVSKRTVDDWACGRHKPSIPTITLIKKIMKGKGDK